MLNWVEYEKMFNDLGAWITEAKLVYCYSAFFKKTKNLELLSFCHETDIFLRLTCLYDTKQYNVMDLEMAFNRL